MKLTAISKFIRRLFFLVLLTMGTVANAATITWSRGSAAWDIGTTAHWSGESTFFNNGDFVSFANTGVTGVAIAAGGVAPASTTFAGNAQSYTFSGAALTGGH